MVMIKECLQRDDSLSASTVAMSFFFFFRFYLHLVVVVVCFLLFLIFCHKCELRRKIQWVALQYHGKSEVT